MSWLQRIKARKAEETSEPEAPAQDNAAPDEGADNAESDDSNGSGDEPVPAPAEPDEDTAGDSDEAQDDQTRQDEPASGSDDAAGADSPDDAADSDNSGADPDPETASAASMAAGSHELFVCLTKKFGAQFAAQATEQGMDYAQALEARVAALEQENRELTARLENRAGMGEESPASADNADNDPAHPRETELRRQGLSKGEAAFAARLNLKK